MLSSATKVSLWSRSRFHSSDKDGNYHKRVTCDVFILRPSPEENWKVFQQATVWK